MCGAGEGIGAGDGECALATAGAGAGTGAGGCRGRPPSEAGPVAGPSFFPFLRFFATTTPAMMIISSSRNSKITTTTTATIHTGKLDFSFPSASVSYTHLRAHETP